MLAGIIQTIIMALGIATGNISSNAYKGGNVFNENKQSQKQQIKRASENLNDTINYWVAQTQTNNQAYNNVKYYLADNTQQGTPNYYTENYNIYNTTYFFRVDLDTSYNYWYLISVYAITNYYGFSYEHMDITQSVLLGTTNNSTQYYSLTTINFTDDNTITNYIDLTLSDGNFGNLRNLVEDKRTNPNATTIITELIPSTAGNLAETSLTNHYTLYNGGENETTYVVMASVLFSVKSHANAVGNITPTSMNIRGVLLKPTINYEVVDIPGLMYTILTMPFSFISTAFNLTIFPGTPYALNFGNLFLTILAIFILLWIIKKVFH